ncbi:DUF3852 domain-containing protein, partial [Dysosmobacter welbionis]
DEAGDSKNISPCTLPARTLAEGRTSAETAGPGAGQSWPEKSCYSTGGLRRYPLPDDRRKRCWQNRLLSVSKFGICLRQRHELSGTGYQGRPGPELRRRGQQILWLPGLRDR